MTVSRDIAHLITEIGRHFEDGKAFDSAVKSLLSEKKMEKEITIDVFYSELLNLFSLADQEVRGAVISEQARDVFIERISRHRKAVFSAIRANEHKQVVNTLKTREVAGDFIMIAENISDSQVEVFKVGDPAEMLASAKSLALSIRKLKIDEVSESAILLQLSSIVDVLNHYDIFGEQNLKQKCKETIQTLNAHWEEIVKKDESTAIKIKEWLTSKLKTGVKIAELVSAGKTVAGLLILEE